MKRILGFLIIVNFFSCTPKLHNSLSKSLKQTQSLIIEKSIIDNPIKDKSGLTLMAIDMTTKDTLSPKVFYSSSNEKGELEGSLIDHLCTVIKLRGGNYKLQVTSLGYDTLNIDSLFFEKGKNIHLKTGLHATF